MKKPRDAFFLPIVCFCHNRLGIYFFFFWLRTRRPTKWAGRRAERRNQQSHTHKQRQTERLLCFQRPQKFRLRHKCLPALHKRHAVNNITTWCRYADAKGGRKEERGNETKAERASAKRERDGWQVCRWLIIVVIWRGFLLTTRPPLPISSLSVHLTDTS